MSQKIAYRIMACKERQPIVDRMVRSLIEKRDVDIKVGYDDRPVDKRKGTYYTQLKCIYDAMAGDYTHLCLLQDDLKLVNDFDLCMDELAGRHPDKLWTLFCSRLRYEEMNFNVPYAELRPANTWGQGNLIPMDMLRDMIVYREDKLPNYLYDDGLYWMYCWDRGIPCYTTRVALLQHLCPTASTLGYNNRNKVSKVWAGDDVYGRINWDSTVFKRYYVPESKKTYEEELKKYGPSKVYHADDAGG